MEIYNKALEKHKVGTVAVKQALHFFHGLTVTQVAAISGVHRRTANSHITAPKGSGVVAWSNRTDAEKWKAVEAGEEILNYINPLDGETQNEVK